MSQSFGESEKRSKKPAVGHEIPLSSMIKNRYMAKIVLMTSDIITGHVTSFDRYTITLQHGDDEFPTTYFKHAIRSFTRV